MPENPKILKVSILGVPNSGKSTLVNRLMNRRVSNFEPVCMSDLSLMTLVGFGSNRSARFPAKSTPPGTGLQLCSVSATPKW